MFLNEKLVLPSHWSLSWKLTIWISFVTICSLLCCARECATEDAAVGVTYRNAVFFKVVRPHSLSYVFKALPARDFGAAFGNYPRPAYLIQAQPPTLCDTDSGDGSALTFDGSLVLVERGGCSFLSKTLIAQEHGAAGVLIYDHEVDNFSAFVDMVDDKSGRGEEVHIPSAFLLGIDGHHLSTALSSSSVQRIDLVIPLNITADPDLLYEHPPWSLY